jgi:crotonobetaine/carnitine-CoA ligase
MTVSKVSDYSAGTRDTVLHMLERAVATAGDRVFFDVAGDTCTFAELDRRATRFAHELARLGVEKGDRVVSILETSADVFTIWFGIHKLGGIWVPINLAYRHEFLRHQIADTGAKLVICDAEFLERITELADRLPEVKQVLVREHEGDLPVSSITIRRFEDYRGTDETPIPIPVEPQDLAALLYTSGTTGPSKGCMISHNYMAMQGRQQIRALAPEPGDVVFCPLPLFHSAAINGVLGALADRHRFAAWPRFSVKTFWEDIERSGATYGMLMASIFALVANAPESEAEKRCKGQLKMVFGVPITPEIRKVWQDRFGVKIVSSWAYGQTENSRLTMALPTDNPPEMSAGRAADEFEVMILDDLDCPVPPGTVGQICLRPRFPNVMFEGYWNRPDSTNAVWKNMWMHTGDLGKMDEDGWMYFADRAKDYLRSRGENISSFEVEATLIGHHDVAEAAVHAIGAQTGEDEIKATLVLREGAAVTHRELCLWAIGQLPYFAVPRFFEFRVELPKNPTGRVLKYRLRDEGLTPDTWDRESEGIQVKRPPRK